LLNGAGGHWFPGRSAVEFNANAIRAALGTHPYADDVTDLLAEAHAQLVDAPKKRLSQGG
jgi:predicted aldo/keto reductase-like oxidoreductase